MSSPALIDIDAIIDRIADAVVDRLRHSEHSNAPQQSAELDVYGVAELLACSVPTVERRTKAGEIPSYTVGRLRRYNRDAVLAAVQSAVTIQYRAIDTEQRAQRLVDELRTISDTGGE
jgi:excisionase family DNA binding protein